MSVLKRSVPYKSEVSIITFATPRTAIASLLAVKNGNCFGINRKLFDKKFLIPEADNKFKFFVTIRNMKEEVKGENVASGFSGIDEYLASIQLK